MTDFHVECVKVGAIEKHPNADTLGITKVGEYPVIVKLGEFQPGDLAVYIPVDSVVPDKPEWAWLDGHRRIKAKKLRGVFSQGLLVKAQLGCLEGDDCAALYEIERYETPQEKAERGGPRAPTLKVSTKELPRYTDLENLRRWPNALQPGETVIIMEKLEGENCRVTYKRASWWRRWFLRDKGSLLVGSRNQIKTEGKWVEVTTALKPLFEALKDPERYALYGESFGYTAGFPYTTGTPRFRLFDVWDRVEKRWLDYAELTQIAYLFDLHTAPLLYWGPWDPTECMPLADGPSSLDPTHIREGFVVRPEHERIQPGVGRVILKCKGEGYLLRKDG